VFPTAITAGCGPPTGDARPRGVPEVCAGALLDAALCARDLIPVRRFKDPFSETLFFGLFVQERATGEYRLAEVKAVL